MTTRCGLAGRAGHRGLALAAFACTSFTYGVGLVIGYHPTFATAGNWPVTGFGWVWITAGLIALTGVLRKDDRWQFAVALWGLRGSGESPTTDISADFH